MKSLSSLQGLLAALLVLSLKAVLSTLLVVLVLRLTHVLPFVPIFDFHLKSEFGVKDLTTEEIKILGEKLQSSGYGPAPPPDTSLDLEEQFNNPGIESIIPIPKRQPSSNVKPLEEEIRSFFTEVE